MPIIISRYQPAWQFIGIAFVFAGCGGKDTVAPVDVEKQAWEDLRSEIRETISDPARESDAVELVDKLVEDFSDFREILAKRHKRVRELNASYDTSRVEFDRYLKQVTVEIQASQRRAGKTHRAFLAVTTPEEWSQLSKVRTKAMTAPAAFAYSLSNGPQKKFRGSGI